MNGNTEPDTLLTETREVWATVQIFAFCFPNFSFFRVQIPTQHDPARPSATGLSDPFRKSEGKKLTRRREDSEMGTTNAKKSPKLRAGGFDACLDLLVRFRISDFGFRIFQVHLPWSEFVEPGELQDGRCDNAHNHRDPKLFPMLYHQVDGAGDEAGL